MRRGKLHVVKRLARGKIKRAARHVAKITRVVAVAHIALTAPANTPVERDIAAANPYYAGAVAEFPKGHDKRRRRKISYAIRPKRKYKK